MAVLDNTTAIAPSTNTQHSDHHTYPVWFLYLIRCRDGQLYTGISTNVQRRFDEHQTGGAKSAKYLRGKGPLTLVYQEAVGNRSQALRREIAVKKLTRAKKLHLISK